VSISTVATINEAVPRIIYIDGSKMILSASSAEWRFAAVAMSTSMAGLATLTPRTGTALKSQVSFATITEYAFTREFITTVIAKFRCKSTFLTIAAGAWLYNKSAFLTIAAGAWLYNKPTFMAVATGTWLYKATFMANFAGANKGLTTFKITTTNSKY